MAGMKGLKKRRRVQVIGLAALSLAAAVAAIYLFVPKQAFNYFRSPSEVVAEMPVPDEVFRIGGLVTEGSILRGEGETIRFSVTDTNATVPVEYTGILPDLFGEGGGVVATGSMQGEVFVATEILAKHDETYMPAEVVDALKAQGVYKDAKGAPGS